MSRFKNNTPDRQITPDDDKEKDCLVCKGEGKVLSDPEIENLREPEPEDYEKCTDCDGEGKVQIKDWEKEWQRYAVIFALPVV